MKKIRNVGSTCLRIRSVGTTKSTSKSIDIAKALGAEEDKFRMNPGQNVLSMYTQKMHIYNKNK